MLKRLSFVVFLGSFIGFSSLVMAASDSDKKTERTLTVQGQGKVSAVPDVATLNVEVNQDGPELDPVLGQVRKQMSKVLEAIKGQGIEDKDVRTEMFQVQPKFERDKRGNSQRAGYSVSNRVSVKVRDLKKTGKTLTAVLNAGATNVDGPHFEVDNPEAAERLALAAATKDAKAKAQAVAEAAGVQLGDILTLNPQNVNWPGPIRPMMMRAMAAAVPMAAAEPVSVGEQTLTGYVSVTYAIH